MHNKISTHVEYEPGTLNFGSSVWQKVLKDGSSTILVVWPVAIRKSASAFSLLTVSIDPGAQYGFLFMALSMVGVTFFDSLSVISILSPFLFSFLSTTSFSWHWMKISLWLDWRWFFKFVVYFPAITFRQGLSTTTWHMHRSVTASYLKYFQTSLWSTAALYNALHIACSDILLSY